MINSVSKKPLLVPSWEWKWQESLSFFFSASSPWGSVREPVDATQAVRKARAVGGVVLNNSKNINISADCVPASQCRQYEEDEKRLGQTQL